ncbi:Uncharacterised protein [Vibrio cholerae]|nr:Uncharacterised protein [Vibrio cholerae]
MLHRARYTPSTPKWVRRPNRQSIAACPSARYYWRSVYLRLPKWFWWSGSFAPVEWYSRSGIRG